MDKNLLTPKKANGDSLRNELIGPTVNHAVENTTFFRELYKGIDTSSIRTVEDLRVLPIIDKDIARAAGNSGLCTGMDCAFIQNTSGTGGDIFLLHRSREEADFIKEFFTELQGSAKSDSDKPLMLVLNVPSHGVPTPIPGNAFVLVQVVIDSKTADNSLQLLRSTYKLPGVQPKVSSLSGTLSQVLRFTAYLLEKGVNMDEFEVKTISVTGNYVSRRCRNLLETVWGAEVFNRYSLTEMFGGATYCNLCGCFHFDPHIVPELVDFVTHEPVSEGKGTIVLTSLYPFVQLQPLIRYKPGDTFELDKNVKCRSTCYRFLGRESHNLMDPDDPGRMLIAGVDFYEALDPHPLFRRSQHAFNLPIFDHSVIGKPLARGFVSRSVGNRLHLKVKTESTVNLKMFPAQCQTLKEEIQAALIESSPALKSDMDSGRITLEIDILPGGVQEREAVHSFEFPSKMWSYEDPK